MTNPAKASAKISPRAHGKERSLLRHASACSAAAGPFNEPRTV